MGWNQQPPTRSVFSLFFPIFFCFFKAAKWNEWDFFGQSDGHTDLQFVIPASNGAKLLTLRLLLKRLRPSFQTLDEDPWLMVMWKSVGTFKVVKKLLEDFWVLMRKSHGKNIHPMQIGAKIMGIIGLASGWFTSFGKWMVLNLKDSFHGISMRKLG